MQVVLCRWFYAAGLWRRFCAEVLLVRLIFVQVIFVEAVLRRCSCAGGSYACDFYAGGPGFMLVVLCKSLLTRWFFACCLCACVFC